MECVHLIRFEEPADGGSNQVMCLHTAHQTSLAAAACCCHLRAHCFDDRRERREREGRERRGRGQCATIMEPLRLLFLISSVFSVPNWWELSSNDLACKEVLSTDNNFCLSYTRCPCEIGYNETPVLEVR